MANLANLEQRVDRLEKLVEQLDEVLSQIVRETPAIPAPMPMAETVPEKGQP